MILSVYHQYCTSRLFFLLLNFNLKVFILLNIIRKYAFYNNIFIYRKLLKLNNSKKYKHEIPITLYDKIIFDRFIIIYLYV